jgi:hypothetical protein
MALAIVGPNGMEPVTLAPIIAFVEVAFVVVAFVVVGLVAFVVVGLVAFVVVAFVVVAFVVVEGKRKVICAYAMFIEHSAAVNKTAITIATNLPGTLVGLPCEFNV